MMSVLGDGENDPSRVGLHVCYQASPAAEIRVRAETAQQRNVTKASIPRLSNSQSSSYNGMQF